MALDWRTKRRALYLGIPLLLVFTVAGFLSWRAYASASCSDGRQNGGELGVDCEGGCSRICEARIKPLSVEWARYAEVEPARYNVMAVIQNENTDLSSRSLPYTLALYKDTMLLWEEKGTSIVPAGAPFSVFAGPVRTTEVPTRATVTLGEPTWEQTGKGAPLTHTESIFEGLDTLPSLEAVISSESPIAFQDVEVGVALYDDQKNAVHLSNTILENIPVRGEGRARFTWPEAFDTITGVCTEPFQTMLLIDRSGSMNENNIDPPEPLTSVKNAAAQFARKIGDEDRAGLVTFATEARVDTELALGGEDVRRAIPEIEILPADETGYTNVGDALKLAGKALFEDLTNASIILLTDGKANWPLQPTGEAYALAEAEKIREAGIPLYSIGLGAGVEAGFLTELSGDATRVFSAGSTDELDRIYSEIGTRLCNREPFFVEIYPKVLYGN